MQNLQIQYIPHSKIYAGEQVRKFFHEETLDGMADSMRDFGVLSPIIVRCEPRRYDGAEYLIVAGEQRWRAAARAQLAEMPCIVTGESSERAKTISVHENTQRRDLTAEEEASVVRDLLEIGYSAARVQKELRKSGGWFSNRKQYLLTAPDVREVGARVPKKMMALIWADKVKSPSMRKSLLRQIEREDLPTSEAERIAKAEILKQEEQEKADRARRIQQRAPDAETESRRNAESRGEISMVSRGQRLTGGAVRYTPPAATSGTSPFANWKSTPAPIVENTKTLYDSSIENTIEALPYSAPIELPPAISSEQLAAQRDAAIEARRAAKEATREADNAVARAIILFEQWLPLCSNGAHQRAVDLMKRVNRGDLSRPTSR